MLPERRAAQELLAGSVGLASVLDPRAPGWAEAARICLSNDLSRDVWIAQIVRDGAFDQAVGALMTLEQDPAGNRDALLAVCLWLDGSPQDALVVAGMARSNRLAGLVELLITVSADPDEWGRRLVDSLTERRPDPVGLVALKPR